MKPSSTQPSKIAKWFPLTMLAVALIGFADATYLAIEHVRGVTPNCHIIEGCDTVTSSTYSEIFGIPVAFGGALYYLSLFLLLVGYFDSKRKELLALASVLTPLGFLASLWFVYVQLGILKAICIYCMLSAGTSTTLWILGMIVLYKTKLCPKKIITELIHPS